MSLTETALLLLAGLAAGTVNATVGSGSLITFPTLLAFGYPPLLANVTNNVGVLPGSFSAVAISRAELVGQGRRLARLSIAALLGALVGAWLLLLLPGAVFDAVVPALIALACVLVAVQPWIAGRVRRRGRPIGHGAALLWAGVLLTGVYGGYFGAAQGVILIAIMGLFIDAPLPQLNAVKNVLADRSSAAAGGLPHDHRRARSHGGPASPPGLTPASPTPAVPVGVARSSHGVYCPAPGSSTDRSRRTVTWNCSRSSR